MSIAALPLNLRLDLVLKLFHRPVLTLAKELLSSGRVHDAEHSRHLDQGVRSFELDHLEMRIDSREFSGVIEVRRDWPVCSATLSVI